MAETIADVPQITRVVDILHRPWVKAVDASEVDYSAGVAKYEHDTNLVRRVALFAKWANYTTVTVKLQRSYDGGTTWTDISGGALTVSGTSVTVTPVAPKTRIHVTATLSAGADTLEAWMFEEYGPLP